MTDEGWEGCMNPYQHKALMPVAQRQARSSEYRQVPENEWDARWELGRRAEEWAMDDK